MVWVVHHLKYPIFFGEAGSRPGSRDPFLSGKGPKTILAVAWSFGYPPRFADTGGAQTRYAQTLRASFPVSTALLGHTTRPEKMAETMSPLKREDQFVVLGQGLPDD